MLFNVTDTGDFAMRGLDIVSCKWEGTIGGGAQLFNSNEEKVKHGVTLLHILSELQEL